MHQEFNMKYPLIIAATAAHCVDTIMHRPLRFAALLLMMHCPAALACGDCVEDRIASVYDHAVVTRALAAKHQVMFFAIGGRTVGTPSERRFLEHVAAGAQGVEAGSARVSTETAALSVAINPARTPVATVERTLQSKMARRSLTLQLLRIMSGPRT